MTDSISLTSHGDRDVRAALATLRNDLPRNLIGAAVRKAAQFLNQFVALVAPKKTGKLASNIVVHTHKTAQTVRARVTVNTIGKADNPLNAFYWRFLEKGFHTRSGEARKYPFIAGVFDAKNVQAAQIVIDSVDSAIDRAEARARS